LEPWLSYIILILFALAVFHFVEVPARRVILQRFSRKPRNLVPAS
jgi:peptidoglycan/LPS O-acetylase OafA/YrhL